jgi:hypothetical protein
MVFSTGRDMSVIQWKLTRTGYALAHSRALGNQRNVRGSARADSAAGAAHSRDIVSARIQNLQEDACIEDGEREMRRLKVA